MPASPVGEMATARTVPTRRTGGRDRSARKQSRARREFIPRGARRPFAGSLHTPFIPSGARDLWSNGFARSLHTQFIPSGARDLWSNGSARSLHRRFAALSINSQNVNSTGPDPLRIQTMFASIASRYDRANTILSAGVHHRWRKAAVRIADPKPGDRILDCATGTGDLAIAFH